MFTKTIHAISQVTAAFGQIMMDPMQHYFGWDEGLSQLLHAGLAFLQVTMAIIAHGRYPDGTKIVPREDDE